MDIFHHQTRVQMGNQPARKINPTLPRNGGGASGYEGFPTNSLHELPAWFFRLGSGEVSYGLDLAIRQRVDDIIHVGGNMLNGLRLGKTALIHCGAHAYK
jgi:hypothetical protein